MASFQFTGSLAAYHHSTFRLSTRQASPMSANLPSDCAQRRRVVVEIDECAAAPGLEAAFAQREVRAPQLVLREDVRRVDELALAVGAPLPPMERAGEALRGAAAVLGEFHAAMTTVVVERLDGLCIDAHDDDRLVEDLVHDEVAGLFDLLQPAGHLPDVRPELLLLELVELAVVVPAGIDPVGARHRERNAGLDPGLRRLGHGSHPGTFPDRGHPSAFLNDVHIVSVPDLDTPGRAAAASVGVAAAARPSPGVPPLQEPP